MHDQWGLNAGVVLYTDYMDFGREIQLSKVKKLKINRQASPAY